MTTQVIIWLLIGLPVGFLGKRLGVSPEGEQKWAAYVACSVLGPISWFWLVHAYLTDPDHLYSKHLSKLKAENERRRKEADKPLEDALAEQRKLRADILAGRITPDEAMRSVKK